MPSPPFALWKRCVSKRVNRYAKYPLASPIYPAQRGFLSFRSAASARLGWGRRRCWSASSFSDEVCGVASSRRSILRAFIRLAVPQISPSPFLMFILLSGASGGRLPPSCHEGHTLRCSLRRRKEDFSGKPLLCSCQRARCACTVRNIISCCSVSASHIFTSCAGVFRIAPPAPPFSWLNPGVQYGIVTRK